MEQPGWAFGDGRERVEGGEKNWIEFTHRIYWALLNCGLRDIRPTAGTASGVHPVPLGFGRVYVNLPDGFNYDAWIKGLAAGRSFVTTGPMIMADIAETEARIRCIHHRETRLELIVNGRCEPVVTLPAPESAKTVDARATFKIEEKGTRWVAVRAWEVDGDRWRFAHTAPVWFDVPDKPLRPRREEAEWFASRVRAEISRSGELLPPEALAEYRSALQFYEAAVRRAGSGPK
jgi:hypothetical protein